MNPIKVFVESGEKRVFTGGLDWPGWCRSARDEAGALQSLLDYGPRYARVLMGKDVEFQAPAAVSEFSVAERLTGNTSTDFGAPGIVPAADQEPLAPAGLERLQTILLACWQAFDLAAEAAAGRKLQKGPRGGGRDLTTIVEHTAGADQAYLSKIGWKYKPGNGQNPAEELHRTRQAIRDALEAAGRGELPTQGPRGGALWPVRYFIRRSAWHVLDHAWEIEDRMV